MCVESYMYIFRINCFLLLFLTWLVNVKADDVEVELSTTLSASDVTAYDEFGSSVYFEEDLIFVGATKADIDDQKDAGALYVFQRTEEQWENVQKLTAAEPSAGANFGEVSYHDGIIVVGAENETETLQSQSQSQFGGAAYVFEKDAVGMWTQTARFTESNATYNSTFGDHSSVHNGIVVVGSPYSDGKGAAYVFEKNNDSNWIEVQKISPSESVVEGSQFGKGLSIYENTIAVGAYKDSVDNLTEAGAVYLFQRDNENGEFSLIQRLISSDARGKARFGLGVHLLDNRLAVGSVHDDNNGVSETGSVYIFERPQNDTFGEWKEVAKLSHSNAVEGDRFGRFPSLYGELLACGTQKKETSQTELAGAVYVFENNDGNWTEIAEFDAPNPSFNGDFGRELWMFDGEIVVSARGATVEGVEDAGEVYIYKLEGDLGNLMEEPTDTETDSSDEEYLLINVEDPSPLVATYVVVGVACGVILIVFVIFIFCWRRCKKTNMTSVHGHHRLQDVKLDAEDAYVEEMPAVTDIDGRL